jgi:hypothetical protein
VPKQSQQGQMVSLSKQRKRKRVKRNVVPGDCAWKQASVKRDSKGRFSGTGTHQKPCMQALKTGEMLRASQCSSRALDVSEVSQSTGITVTCMDAATGELSQHVFQRATNLGLVSCKSAAPIAAAADNHYSVPGRQQEAYRKPVPQASAPMSKYDACVEQPQPERAGDDKEASTLAGSQGPEESQTTQQAAKITLNSPAQQNVPRNVRHEKLFGL